jgi:hypothetical protein
MKKREKRLLYSATAAVIIVLGVTALHHHSHSSSPVQGNTYSPTKVIPLVTTDYLTYSAAGLINLYNSNHQKLDTVNLSEHYPSPNLSPNQIHAHSVIKSQKSSKSLQKIANQPTSNHVKVIVLSGDTAWGIQKRLTPNANIATLLEQDQQLNPNQSLSIIRAGTALYFVENTKGIPVASKLTKTPIVSKPPIKKKAPSQFLYQETMKYGSTTLYALNTHQHVLDKITVQNGKLTVSVVRQLDTSIPVYGLQMTRTDAYLLESKGIEQLSIINGVKKFVSLNKMPTVWTANASNIYFGEGSYLVKESINTHRQIRIQTGATIESLTDIDGSLYLVNRFGTGLGHHLLLRIEDNSMKVENLKVLYSSHISVYQNINPHPTNLYVLENSSMQGTQQVIVRIRDEDLSTLSIRDEKSLPKKGIVSGNYLYMTSLTHFHVVDWKANQDVLSWKVGRGNTVIPMTSFNK